MEVSKFTETENGRTGKEQDQEHAHHFILSKSQGISPGTPNSQLHMLI
jgi:hypothetical protein